MNASLYEVLPYGHLSQDLPGIKSLRRIMSHIFQRVQTVHRLRELSAHRVQYPNSRAERNSASQSYNTPTHNEARNQQVSNPSTIPSPVATTLTGRLQTTNRNRSRGQNPKRASFIEPSDEPSARSANTKTKLSQQRLECPFYSLSCYQTFNDSEEWRAHSISHFGEADPPQKIRCCFCAKEYFDSFSLNAIESWKAYMKHLEYHQRKGCQMGNTQPDLDLYKYMWEKQLISSSDYQRLQNPSAHPTSRLPDLVEPSPGRHDDSWTLTGPRPASPNLTIPTSCALMVNPQKVTPSTSARKRRLGSAEREHLKLVRKQGACEDCRRKKKRVSNFSSRNRRRGRRNADWFAVRSLRPQRRAQRRDKG